MIWLITRNLTDGIMFDDTSDHMVILIEYNVIGLGSTAGKHHICRAAAAMSAATDSRAASTAKRPQPPKLMNR